MHNTNRNQQHLFTGAAPLLVLFVMLAGALASCGQPANTSTHSGSAAIPTSASRTPPPLRSIPVPTAKPINSPVWSQHNVTMVTVDGVAYVGTMDNAVYALRTNNGSVLWRTGIDGLVDESPAVTNGIVYVSSYVGQNGPSYLYALRKSDGKILWRYSDNSNYIYSPPVDNGVVYVAAQNDGVTALRASDGTRLWYFATPGGTESPLPPPVSGILYVSAPIDGQAGGVVALRANDGSVLWRYPTSNSVDSLLVSSGVIYITSNGKMAALQASNGHQMWSRVIDTTFYQSPQLVNGVIYILTTKYLLENIATPTAQNAGFLSQTMTVGALLSTGMSNGQAAIVKETIPLKQGKAAVYAIRASDGVVLWQFPMNKGGYSFAYWLQVENGIVYASASDAESGGSTGYLYALQSSDGSVAWQDKVTGSPFGTILSNGVIYSSVNGDSDSAVYALHASDGGMLWSYPVGGSVYNSPILDGTMVFAGADNGVVYALRADNGALMWHYLTMP